MASDGKPLKVVVLQFDATRFTSMMSRVAAAAEAFSRALHRAQHHRVEDLAVSAMHAAYDRRRRARRRRR
jgi:hypothetical protein